MTIELYFSLGLLIFGLIVIAIVTEHYIVTHWVKKDSLLMKTLKSFEKRHPDICDNEDTFYCFFKRNLFTKH